MDILRRDDHLIICDWDNTLFPTLWAEKHYRSQTYPYSPWKDEISTILSDLDWTILSTLEKLSEMGIVYILTASQNGWVHECLRYLPMTYHFITTTKNVEIRHTAEILPIENGIEVSHEDLVVGKSIIVFDIINKHKPKSIYCCGDRESDGESVTRHDENAYFMIFLKTEHPKELNTQISQFFQTVRKKIRSLQPPQNIPHPYKTHNSLHILDKEYNNNHWVLPEKIDLYEAVSNPFGSTDDFDDLLPPFP
jgi:hypothetical protein